MRLDCDLYSLTRAATASSQVVKENAVVPVMRCLKLTTDGDRLTVLGYDRESWIRTTVLGVTVHEPGSCLVPARDFLNWLRVSPPGVVSLYADQYGVHMERHGTVNLPVHPVGDYPEPDPGRVVIRTRAPNHTETEVEVESPHLADVHLPAGTLIAAIARVLFCSEKKESSKFVTKGVVFKVGDLCLTIAATDTRHVAQTVLETARPMSDGKPISAIVPADVLHKLAHAVGAEPEVSVALSEHSVVFKGDASELGTRLLDGKFPPYEKYAALAYDNDATKLELPTKAFLDAILQATAVTPEGGQAGRLQLAFNGAGALGLSTPGVSAVTMTYSGLAERHLAAWYAPDVIDFLRVATAQGSKSLALYPPRDPHRQPWLIRALPGWDYYPPAMVENSTTAKETAA